MLDKEKTQKVVKKFGKSKSDSGSPEVQIALLTERIQGLTTHVGQHLKDFSTRRGLLALVSQRRQLLSFLKSQSEKRYQTVVTDLGLRK